MFMDYEKMTDVEILKRIRAQDDDAMEYLLKKHSRIVKRETRTLYLIGAEMEDLAQEGMIGLFKAIRDFKEESGAEFATFATICVQRQIRTAIKASTRQKHTPLNEYVSIYANEDEEGNSEDFFEAEPANANPENIMLAREQHRLLEDYLLATLSDYEKQVLSYYLEGLSYAEIARKLEKTEKSINNALQRIRAKQKGSRENEGR